MPMWRLDQRMIHFIRGRHMEQWLQRFLMTKALIFMLMRVTSIQLLFFSLPFYKNPSDCAVEEKLVLEMLNMPVISTTTGCSKLKDFCLLGYSI